MPDAMTEQWGAIQAMNAVVTGDHARGNRLDDVQFHQSEALYAIAQLFTGAEHYDENIQTLKTHVNALNPGKYKFDGPPIAPAAPETKPTFTVWTGSTIPQQYRTVQDITDAIVKLEPGRFSEIEWIVKAGEGGDYQHTWDPHPLAPKDSVQLKALYDAGKAMRLKVTPYVNVRGRNAWNAGEWSMIGHCVLATGECILNLENGPEYWNGPTDPTSVSVWLAGLKTTMQAMGARTDTLGLCSIPRLNVWNALGGLDTMDVWLAACNRASWECYDATAEDLNAAKSIALVRNSLTTNPLLTIPVVQRSRITAWSDSELVAHGVEVWHLGGD